MTRRDDATQALVDLYPQVYRLLHRRSGAEEDRLTPQSQALLLHLAQSGPLTVGEIAKHIGRAQSAVSETLDALEQRGLLSRMRDERDRRRTLVWLTDDARALLDRQREVLDRPRVASAVGRMSASERADLIRGLTALIHSAEALRPSKKEPSS